LAVKKKGYGYGILLAALFAWATAAHTQPFANLISFDNLSVKNGLSNNLVQCLLQDSRGFLWAGTANGITFKQYKQVPGNVNSLPGNHINNLCEDTAGNIWIGTSSGLSRFNMAAEIFTNFMPGSNCHVYTSKQGTTWISNNNRLSRYNPAQNSFTHYPVDLGQQRGITRNHNIRAAYEDSRKRLWLPTSFGVKLFNPATGTFTSFHFPEQQRALAQNAVIAVKEDAGGGIYACTWGAGLLRFNEQNNRFEMIPIAAIVPGTIDFFLNVVQDLLIDGPDAWLATEQGLIKARAEDLQRQTVINNYHLYTHNPVNDRSLASNNLFSLLKDKAGCIWIAAKGISRCDPMKQQFVTVTNISDKGKLLGPTAFVADRTGTPGSYLFGSYNLYGAEYNTARLTCYNAEPYIHNPAFGSVIWDIAAGKNGYWLASTNGLIQLNHAKKIIRRYPIQPGNNATASERLWKVYEDSYGLVWAATVRHGVSLLNPATGSISHFFSRQHEPNSLFNAYTTAFFEDRQHNIWFGANRLLYQYQRSSKTFLVYPLRYAEQGINQPRPFMQDAAGNIWLASEAGLFKFTAAQKLQPVVSAGNPELNNGQCVTTDLQGNIWLGTNAGLFRYDTALKKLTKYTTGNGLESNENINSIATMPDGSILLGGDGYITRFDPLLLKSNTFVPPVVITKIQVNGKDTTTATSRFSLPFHTSIGFEFAALNFSNAEKNQYQYMLKGIDKEWIAAGNQRTVLYGELPPGRYEFMVKGSNNDGVWNNSPAVFRFLIPVPWYRTWWFITLVIAAIAALLYLAYRYRLGQLLQMERMRTRIATDLHDDIGATLSSISMYSDAVKKQLKGEKPQIENILDKMGESSREMVTGMSDIVWAINPGNDEGEKLVKRMENYAADICAIRNISLHFSADEKLMQTILPLEHRKNIYLVFKESVNNAVKYAAAKNIHVQLSCNGKKITLLVMDDGKGFDAALIRPGNGLKNLQLRAAEIKGILTVQTSPGKGVAVQLSCHI
jgi:signal transduction histidine kinase/ligand-binding sensor domain-containing protein